MRIKYPPIHSKDSSKVYVVLGAMRSGTTFLARAIQDALVTVHGDGKHGRMSIEGDAVSSINRYILTEGADRWGMIDKFLSDMRQDFWGMKDPQMSLTFDKWLPHFDDNEDVYVVAVFRKPKRVLDSMEKLGKWPGTREEKERDLRKHNEKTLEQVRRFLDEA